MYDIMDTAEKSERRRKKMKMFVKDIRVPFVSRGSKWSYGEHYHYEFEYWHMIDGRAEVRVSGKSYTLSSGQVFIAFPFVEHEYVCEGENLSTVGIFPPSDIHEFTDILLRYRPVNPVISVSEMFPGFNESLDRFFAYFSGGGANRRVVSCMLGALIGEMLSATQFESRGGASPDVFEKLIDYCLENFCDPELTLERTASTLGYSRCYLSHVMSESVGIGFTKFLNSLRVDKSRKILLNAEIPITTVALECGFGSIRTFNRVFAGLTGVTPRDFRREWGGRDTHDYYEKNAGMFNI